MIIFVNHFQRMERNSFERKTVHAIGLLKKKKKTMILVCVQGCLGPNSEAVCGLVLRS